MGFGLWPVSGESGAEGGEKCLANRSRSETARRRAADGSPPRLRSSANAVRDERGFLRRRTGAVVRHTGRPADRETERKPALVTAVGVYASIFSDVLIDIMRSTHHIWCVMKITKQATDKAVLAELGERLTRIRLERNLTQVQLAGEAGVAKSTVQRLEAGAVATQLSGFIRVCRVLDLIERFDLLIPEPVPSPVEQLKLAGRKRQRASTAKPAKVSDKKWQWGDKP